MVKLWRPSGDEDVWTQVDEIVNFDKLSSSYLNCRPIQGDVPDLEIVINSNNTPTDYFFAGPLFVVSNRLKVVLEEHRVNAEYVPVEVVYHGALYTERQFSFVNLLDCVDCIDLERSKYVIEPIKRKPGIKYNVDILAIDESKAAGFHLFRLGGKVQQVVVLVSDELAERVSSDGFTGIEFAPPHKLHRH